MRSMDMWEAWNHEFVDTYVRTLAKTILQFSVSLSSQNVATALVLQRNGRTERRGAGPFEASSAR